jgi:peptidoglycan hydrolase-like protein with peptidoglycan-binding domain
MFSVRRLFTIVVAAGAIITAPSAFAKECQKEAIVQSGSLNVVRTIAYASSLFAWRQAVESKHGKNWMSWSSAEGRAINCEQRTADGRRSWICTRTARPCLGTGPEGTTAGTAPAPGAALTERMKRGDTDDNTKGQVTALQKVLAAKGYSVTADGKFGRGTERAVIEFQRKEKLKADGIVGTETRARLNAGLASAPSSAATALARKLRRGDQGDDVRRVQEALRKKGYDVAVDGKYGRGTERAVNEFQRKGNLKADGVVGDETWKALGA